MSSLYGSPDFHGQTNDGTHIKEIVHDYRLLNKFTFMMSPASLDLFDLVTDKKKNKKNKKQKKKQEQNKRSE